MMKNGRILMALALVLLLLFCSCSRNPAPVDPAPASSSSSGVSSAAESSSASESEAEEESKTEQPEKKEDRFPAGSSVNGIDISGKTAAQAQTAATNWAEDYSLTLTVNGTSRTYAAADFGIAFKKTNFSKLLKDALADASKKVITVEEPVVYDDKLVDSALAEFPGAYNPAKDAYLSYSTSAGAFVLNKEEKGSKLDMSGVKESVVSAILSRETSVSETAEKSDVEPDVTMDSTRAKNALNAANALLDVVLTYTYSPEGGTEATETIGKSLIAKWLVPSGLSVTVSSYNLSSYCSEMNTAHSAGKQYVDEDALKADIESCILNGVSGTRKAPYLTKTAEDDMTSSETYIEINLTAQHMWLYKNGSCLVSTDIVSGCVNWGMATPPGVFAIQSHVRNATLYGEGYVTPVNYWMGFNGGIGIHDSTWRGSYGGTIYQYDGSHGCINTPYDAVATIFENVTVGTPVIVYGGSGSVTPVTQTITTAKDSYTVDEGSAAFNLNAKPKYTASLTYSSSNTSVATVSSDGTVTPVGHGSCTITVKAEARTGFSAATKSITVKVEAACAKTGAHTWDKGKVTTAATCSKTGVMTYTCKDCGKTKTESIPKTDHSWDKGKVTKAATCEKDGVMTYTCAHCHTTRTEAIPATGHTWDKGKVTKAATCEKDGVMTYTCKDCGKTRTEAIPATGHAYDEGTVTVEPGCETPGEITYTCGNCGGTYTEEIAPLGHHYEDGVCTVCGEPDPNAESSSVSEGE